MTSKIVVNNIEADAGVSTVTFGSKISSTEFVGPVVGNVTGNLTGTASTATAAATAYGISGSPTLSGITSVSTTNLTVNGNAYPNAGPLSNRNLIINGDMQVWQRGTSSTSSDFRTADRFYYNFGNTLAGTQSRQTLSSGTPYDEGFRYSYRFTISTPGDATSTYCQLIQGIEAQNIATSGWQYASADSDITVSFWVQSSVAQTFYGAFVTEDGTQQTYVFSFALSAGTWTKVTKTIPGNSNVTIDNNTGKGADLIIYPFMGTNYSDSGVNVDAWQAYGGGTRIPDMDTTWMSTNGATFEVTGVQLEVGSVATPFEHRSFGDELLRCQRYYYRVVPEGNVTGFGPCAGQNGTRALAYISFPTSMRVRPTSLQQSGTASDYYIRLALADTVCNSVPTMHDKSTENGAMLNVYVASGLSGGYAAIFGANTSNGYLAFSADI